MKDRYLMMMDHTLLRNGGTTTRQLLKLGELLEDWHLQSNTILAGVVADSFLTACCGR